jgi:hypothetical protein
MGLLQKPSAVESLSRRLAAERVSPAERDILYFLAAQHSGERIECPHLDAISRQVALPVWKTRVVVRGLADKGFVRILADGKDLAAVVDPALWDDAWGDRA